MNSEEELIVTKYDEPYVKKPITSYKMRPGLAEIFKANGVKFVIQNILNEKLVGKIYNVDDARRWTKEISDSVSVSVKEIMDLPRYKHVVQVTIGQHMGSGCRYIAKCCWDAETDAYTSDVFSNTSLFCVCTVFGIYLY